MSNYPPGVTGNEPEITGEARVYDERPLYSIRIPERVMFYMDSTGWGQGAEKVTDAPRLTLLAAKPHKDGTVTIDDPDEEMLGRLYFEADHLADSYRFGDHDADTRADYRAAMKLIAKIKKIDPMMSEHRAREIVFGVEP